MPLNPGMPSSIAQFNAPLTAPFTATWLAGSGWFAICVCGILLLGGTLFAQQTDWIASNNPDIQYRDQVLDRAQACYLEFRDQKQGAGYTTFDAAVDYNSTDLNADGKPTKKTDTEHIVTAPTHSGSARIPNCSAVVEIRVSFLQRH
jgi:hypothetical protein